MVESNYIRAEAKSFALLKRFGIEDRHFDIDDLAFALGIEVKDGGIASGDAWIVRHDDGTGTIRLNSVITSVRRRRFSIAHELGHWELHPNLSQGYLCTGKNLRDYGQSPEESEANWFAATLLMPKFLLAPETFKKDPNFTFIRQLASDFQTSFTAAARRFVELSRQPIVLVASSSPGRVLWIARSKPASYLFVMPGQGVPHDSLTGEVLRGESTKTDIEPGDFAIWFPDLRVSDDAELFEQVSYSAELEMTLTLLWAPQ
jgi:Zn-dependent peptidase ImmA (M78 family)